MSMAMSSSRGSEKFGIFLELLRQGLEAAKRGSIVVWQIDIVRLEGELDVVFSLSESDCVLEVVEGFVVIRDVWRIANSD